MLYGSLLSAALMAASSFTYATPVPADHRLAEKAKIIPFVNKHVVARISENYSPVGASKRDLQRVQKRNERIAAINRSGGKANKSMKRAAALEPFDIGNVLREALKKRQDDSAIDPLVNYRDKVYYGELSVGTPAQVTTIDFDTGSSDLIIPSIDCAACVGPFYDPNESGSYRCLNSSFSTGFLDGSTAAGVLANETISMGSLSVENQTFAVITSASEDFDGPFSGLMGLGFQPIAHTNATPWFFNLAHQESLASNVFSFYMSRQEADGSELCIGCINSEKFTGEPEYFPLVPGNAGQTEWSIISDGITYNNAVVTQSLTAVIDSGTSKILVPPSYAADLYAIIPGAEIHTDNKHYIFPCASADTMDLVGFTFSGSESVFNIQPSQFNAGPVEEGSDMCVGAIVASKSENGVAIVGDTFMSSWYSIFDYGNMRVGFAEAL